MVLDGRSLTDGHTVEADVCIVGAGAAGITLAREFVGAPFRVCLVEGGGFEGDAETQALYRGENVGRPYFSLDAARLRYFGGSTNHWAGWCRPLEAADFEMRDWVPHSGWPLGKAELDPYYERAQPVCELGPYRYDAGFWNGAGPGAPLPLGDGRIETIIFQFAPRIGFGHLHGDEITGAPNITTLLHSSLTELISAGDGGTVSAARVRTLAGNEFRVRARIYILALGGIANPQLLLASRSGRPAGLGNPHDLVGRFFMEHPHHNRSARFVPARRRFVTLPFYEASDRNGTPAMGVLAHPESVLRRESLLHMNCSFHRTREAEPPGYRSLHYLAGRLLRGRRPTDLRRHVGNVVRGLDGVASGVYTRARGRQFWDYEISFRYEQQPNRLSRVTITDERDAVGLPRVRLDWRLTDEDLRSIRRSQEIVAAEIGRAGVGRLQLSEEDGTHPWAEQLIGGSHHMGTTRMAASPRQGVVDPDCRVHDVANVYVAGSSVFPTAGSANPTLTIVALAVRLADHVKERLA
jgi:choline dehydrogenase-like flavoprotein